ncbi:sigma-70 family RNA polymerase sigma factor [Streptomyces wuyuanensis]|uniref:sigma-70 family RNA polymerase sigma factor n=1 Tax=Streptomyces wuyuanensis TaxID=1196353 RepID=UPI003F4CED2B
MHLQTPPTTGTLHEAVSVFVQHRPRLFGIACRVLGSTADAEDVVQEVWLRWQKTDRSAVVSPAAFLSVTTTRLSINIAKSAHACREVCLGPRAPEPVDTSAEPEAGAQRAEALELALRLVLERLTPVERAAYVLREAFEYAYSEIAEILQVSLVNVRKIVSRARRRLSAGQRGTVDATEHRRLVDTFVAAARTGDVASLEALLTPGCLVSVRRARYPGRRLCTCPGPCARGQPRHRATASTAQRAFTAGRGQRPYRSGTTDAPSRVNAALGAALCGA